MAWNYKHNTTLPQGTIVNCPDPKLRGNVCYIAKWGYANQAAVDAIDNTAQIGSLDYPFNSFTNYKALIATHLIYISVIDKGVYGDENQGDISSYVLIGDESYTTNFTGSGSFPFCTKADFIANIVFNQYVGLTAGLSTNTYNLLNCILNVPIISPFANVYGVLRKCICTNNVTTSSSSQAYVKSSYFFNNIISINESIFDYCIFLNTSITCTNIAKINYNNNIFWNGTITVGVNTYDLSAAIAFSKSEATIQSEIGALFSVTFVGRIINPRSINAVKGNFNMDYINYATDVAKILTAQVSYPNVAKRGVKCEWDAVLATSDYIFSGSSPHYSALDGFNGLICRNLNADGSIINTAYDTVAVSKIITLPSVAVLDFLLQFGTFGAGALEWDELYVRAVASGAVEDEYSIASGYKASYTANVFTCDWPRFYLNREQKCNKVGGKALGLIDKGAYNLDEARSIFKTGAIEFQFILVKRGV